VSGQGGYYVSEGRPTAWGGRTVKLSAAPKFVNPIARNRNLPAPDPTTNYGYLRFFPVKRGG
jgi:hypothetical protein